MWLLHRSKHKNVPQTLDRGEKLMEKKRRTCTREKSRKTARVDTVPYLSRSRGCKTASSAPNNAGLYIRNDNCGASSTVKIAGLVHTEHSLCFRKHHAGTRGLCWTKCDRITIHVHSGLAQNETLPLLPVCFHPS